MRHASIPALVALVLLSTAPEVSAQTLPQPGSCVQGTAQSDLEANDVFARVFNTGSLFFGNQSEAAYVVPKASGKLVRVRLRPLGRRAAWDGELRVAGARYDNFKLLARPARRRRPAGQPGRL